MQERLLQYIWQHQYFNRRELHTEAGEPLQIVFPGTFNTGQGPDFLHAAIRIGGTRWAGQIELHIRSSDWDRHGHEKDPNYNNVILHVVWEDDRPTKGRRIPTLVLGARIAKQMLASYEEWMNSATFIPCASQQRKVNASTWQTWKQTLLQRRLHRQAQDILVDLAQCNHHWETVTWWRIARNFGIPVNGEVFEAIARSIPVAILSRHRQNPEQLEALLLGQAGLCENNNTEFNHLKTKYQLQPIHQPLLFSHMRPAAAPAKRLTQLALLLTGSSSNWLSRLKEAQHPGDVTNHILLPKTMQNSLLINSFIPLLYAHGLYYDNSPRKQKALAWLQALPPEKNARLTGWRQLGVTNINAGESQALLELKKHYCDQRKCLDCSIGRSILSEDQHQP